ncbi:cell wall protein, partial [Streptomyces sp. SID11233]|nr:cell wall protein [Streptomyces sp. SID11233]
AQPRVWKRAVRWLVAAGLHPRANTTTLRVTEDLAARMDFVEGLVLYDLDGTAARLDVDRSTVKRHVAVLRQLG